jgi:hypothetical protein
MNAKALLGDLVRQTLQGNSTRGVVVWGLSPAPPGVEVIETDVIDRKASDALPTTDELRETAAAAVLGRPFTVHHRRTFPNLAMAVGHVRERVETVRRRVEGESGRPCDCFVIHSF